MGYYLNAFLGDAGALRAVEMAFVQARMVIIGAELSMVPMTQELFDEMNGTASRSHILKLERLTEEVERRVLSVIGSQKIAYVESEFFGGNGGHAGVVWESGHRTREEALDGGSMNRILNFLGVARMDGRDEFLVAGLGKHRRTSEWLT